MPSISEENMPGMEFTSCLLLLVGILPPAWYSAAGKLLKVGVYILSLLLLLN